MAVLSRVLLPVGAFIVLCVLAYRSLGLPAVGIGVVAAVFSVAYIGFIERRYRRKHGA
jgi:hypothetical protein